MPPGLQRSDYGYDGKGKTPRRRQLQLQRGGTEAPWPLYSVPPSQEELDRLVTAQGDSITFYIQRHFRMLVLREIHDIKDAYNDKRETPMEYYDFLPVLRDIYCLPAIQDVVAGTCVTFREAIVKRLQIDGLFPADEPKPEEPKVVTHPADDLPF